MIDARDVLVTGGSGTLGRLLVPRLLEAGCRVRTMSRTPGTPVPGVEHHPVDLETGDGVEAALAGAGTVVHLAGSQKRDGAKARTLVDAARRARVEHLVFVSVVGADRVPVTSAIDRAQFGYFAQKREAEVAIQESGIPWTTLRATQFHELGLLTLKTLGRGPLAFVFAGIRFQPIAAAEVAERLTQLTLGAPGGLVPNLAGPQVRGMDDLMRSYLASIGRRSPVVRIPVAGGAGRAMKAGANLDESRAVGRQTFEEFLASRG